VEFGEEGRVQKIIKNSIISQPSHM